jgi:hypothetical protein
MSNNSTSKAPDCFHNQRISPLNKIYNAQQKHQDKTDQILKSTTDIQTAFGCLSLKAAKPPEQSKEVHEQLAMTKALACVKELQERENNKQTNGKTSAIISSVDTVRSLKQISEILHSAMMKLTKEHQTNGFSFKKSQMKGMKIKNKRNISLVKSS